jgi:hypothetical protein
MAAGGRFYHDRQQPVAVAVVHPLGGVLRVRLKLRRAQATVSQTAPGCDARGDDHADDADLQIPLGDAPVPARGGQPCPPRIGAIRLSVAETARLTLLATQAAAGLITRARLAFALRWSARRRRHQATARWHHHSARLLAAAT